MTAHGDGNNQRRSPLIRKIFWTALVGLTVYAGTAAAGEALHVSPADQLVLSVLTSGVALLVQYLAEFEQRLFAFERDQRRSIAALGSAVQHGLTGVNEAAKLHDGIGNSALDQDILKRAIRYAGNFTDRVSPLILRLANSEVERLGTALRELSSNHELFYEGEDREYLLALARQAQKSIFAVSWTVADGVDSSFWSTDLGCRYLDLQNAAIGRHVTTKRLFVLDSIEQTAAAELAPIVDLHRGNGIETRTLLVKPTDRAALNFAIFDGEIMYVTAPVSRSNTSGELTTHLVFDQDSVRIHTSRFERLWESASD